MRFALVSAAALAAFALTACNRGGSNDAGGAVEETGKELSKNPFKAMNQLAEAGQKMADKAKEMESRKPVDPVKFDVLLPLLPSPDGWKGDEAKGATSAMGEFKVTTVSRSYEKDGSRVKIEIVDGGYVPFVYAGFTMMSSFSHESTEGHSKGIEVEGYPAVEEWKKKDKDAKIVALVKDRFLVTIDGDNVEPEVVRDFVAKLDLKKVGALDAAAAPAK